MLPKENRLRRKKDFEKVLKEGKRFSEDSLFLKIKENNSQTNRVGFIISKKISKKATVRNKIKRRLREIVCSYLNKIQAGFDLVFLARSGIEKKDFLELEEIVYKIFKKSKIFKYEHLC